MRSMLAAGLAVLTLAACSETPGRPGGGPASYNNLVPPPGQSAVADAGCVVHSHHGIVRVGDNIPVNYLVANTGRWCWWGFGVSGVNAAGTRLVDHPEHGEVRVLPIQNGIAVGYRPSAGYAGIDTFLVTTPTGYGGYDYNVSATVNVHPPQP